jgi:hypothetical protein
MGSRRDHVPGSGDPSGRHHLGSAGRRVFRFEPDHPKARCVGPEQAALMPDGVPYAVQVVVWIVTLALIGNVIGLGVRLFTRRR